MRNLYLYISLFFVAVSMSISSFAFAASQGKPLMVIRFINGTADYSQTLDKAVKMALDAKSAVSFNLVAVIPETKYNDTNKQAGNEAKFLAEKIADQIKESGVSADMIHTDFEQNKLIKDTEVQIFVQ